MLNAIGPFTILDVLGEGGMGRVYRAQHTSTGQIVALKAVRVSHRAVLASVRREIRMLAGLSHPGIVRILEHGLHQGTPWYAMELLSGFSMRHCLQSAFAQASQAPTHLWKASVTLSRAELVSSLQTDETWFSSSHFGRTEIDVSRTMLAPDEALLPPEFDPTVTLDETLQPELRSVEFNALEVLAHLCSTLTYLHGEGVVHRDLKPENIIITDEGRVVLVDFGLAQLGNHGGISRERLEIVQGASGTALYMAPEQIDGGEVDARADLYALGCMLYEATTGAPPFTAMRPLQILSQHLNTAPTPPLQLAPGLAPGLDALILSLLGKKPGARPGYAEDVLSNLVHHARLRPIPTAHTPKPYLYRPDFVGQSDVFRHLFERCEALGRGRGGLVLVRGESGVGKTRFAIELCRSTLNKLRPLTGTCEPDLEPYHPLQHALEAIADAALDDGRSLGTVGHVLASISSSIRRLPEFEGAPPLPELPPRESALRLHVALTTALFSLARERPLLLVLDDLQWADDDTLDWLAHLMKVGLHDEPLLILGLYRKDGRSHVQRIEGMEGVEACELERLDADAVERMIHSMLGWSSAPDDFVGWLMRSSEGNPYFVAEFLRAAVEEGVLRRIHGDWKLVTSSQHSYTGLGLPTQISTLLLRRLTHLPEPARRLSERLAVFGHTLDTEIWTALSLPMPLLDTLFGADIVDFDAHGGLTFSSHTLRDIACEHMNPERFAALHRDAALLLEKLSRHPAHIARHWELSGDVERARLGYREAIEGAQHDSHGAVRYAEAFLRLLPEVPERDAERAWGLRVLARSYNAIGELDAAMRTAIHARDMAERAGETESERDVVVLLSDILRIQNDHHQAASMLDSRAALFDTPRAHRRWLITRGEIAMFCGELERGYQCIVEARDLSRDAGDDEMLSKASAVLGGYHLRNDDLSRAYDAYHVAYNACRDPRQRAIIQKNLGLTYQNAGRLDDARHHLEASLMAFREMGARRFEALNLSGLASVLNGIDDERATAYFETAIAALREIGDRRALGTAHANFGELLQRLGRHADADRHFAAALPHLIHAGDRRFEGITRYYMATAEQDRGAFEAAERHYHDALRILRVAGAQIFEAEVLLGLASLYRRFQRLDDAECHLELAGALFETLRDAFGLGNHAIELGYLRLARDQDPEDAHPRALEALAQLGGTEPKLERACEDLACAIRKPSHERIAGEDPDRMPALLRDRLILL